MTVLEIREYLDNKDRSPFRRWFETLNPVARDQVGSRLDRLAAGNPGDVKSIGGGALELRIHHGPGYRVYVAFDGRTLVILLGGGSKRDQDRDIANARAAWSDYKARKARR
jgi:putative addiction module killer protein